MAEVGPSSEESDLSAEPPLPRHDFSCVQGFQVVGAEGRAEATSDSQAWRDALRLELEARAARFHQAVDAAIVLANDGVIRWLGDPVAKLSAGPDLLNPKAVIFADEALPAEARDTVKTRVELWVAATTRRLLAPLFLLEAIQEGPEIVRELARELARSLGILEREPIKTQIKALSQNDRGELRKQGVRFGAHYIFVPALIKPAPRALALQLWSLQAPGDPEEILRTLSPVASSGRTSLAFDKGISKDGYRVAGYRPCGERAVRVDVVERLAGMIRAAIGGEAAGVGPERANARASKGFIVTGQMTSLTGCSGEHFASILRSMGFRAVEMKRSEFFGSPAASEPAEQREPPAGPEAQEAGDRASLTASADEPVVIEPTLDAPADPSADAIPEDEVAEGPAAAEAVAEGVEAEGAAEGATTDGAEAEGPAEGFEAGGDEAEGAEGILSPVSADSSDGALAEGADASSPQAQSADGERAQQADDVITVWRPKRRRVWLSREKEGKQPKFSKSGTSDRSDIDGQNPVQRPKRPAAHPSKPNRHAPFHSDEKRRQRPSEYDMPRNPMTAPQHKAKVDPNSPFAKLLELRPLLEEQAHKRP